jgi:tetratricopeptide (TPR) repeat protein
LKIVPGSRRSAAKLLYSLIYCGLVNLGPTLTEDTKRETSKVHNLRLALISDGEAKLLEHPALHRRFVLDTYRRIDWISHYDLLGVLQTSTLDQIEVAYRERSRLFSRKLGSEDIFADCSRQLSVLSARLAEAHAVLANPDARKIYDDTVRQGERVIEQAASATGNQRLALNGEETSSAEVRMAMAAQNYERAKELIQARDYFPAIQMLEEAVRFVPNHPEYLYVLGTTQLKNRYWRDEGIENLRKAAELQPKNHAVWASLAQALRDIRLLVEAKRCADKALELLPRKLAYQKLAEELESALREAGKSPRPSRTRLKE